MFSMLVEANENEEAKFKLDESELVSAFVTPLHTLDLMRFRLEMRLLCFWLVMVSLLQCFWTYTRGLTSSSETTAHTLAATIGFLALHDDIQKDIFQHIISVIGKERNPVRSFDNF